MKNISRNCPRTGKPLTPALIGGITVDISEGCGGVFFDNFELERFDEQHELNGEQLVQHLKQFHNSKVDLNKRVHCPNCKDKLMFRRFHSPKRQIEIDECRHCGGIWLDAGELEHIRTLFPSSADRQKASDDFYQELIRHSDFQALNEDKNQQPSHLKSFSQFLFSLLRQ